MSAQRLQLAIAHMQAHRFAEAGTLLLQVVQREPDNVRALNLLSSCLCLQLQGERAVYYARQALARSPGTPAIHATLANALTVRRQFDEASAAYQRAWDGGLRDGGIAGGMMFALREGMRWSEGVVFARAARREPGLADDPTVLNTLCECLKELGRAEEALGLLEAELARVPGFAEHAQLHMTRAVLMHYVPPGLLGASTSQRAVRMREAHERAAALLTAGVTGVKVSAGRGAWPGAVRVGFVSADFRRHSCAWFVLALLGGLAGKAHRTLYQVAQAEDDITRQCQASCEVWRQAWELSDEQLAQRVQQDEIDVLVDLSGLTSFQKLGVFARRPAPLQVTWLGYPGTTGLHAMDARLVDATTDPPGGLEGGAQEACVETLVRLSRVFVCYQPPPEARELLACVPSREASGRGAGVVLCAFGSVQKYNTELLGAWGAILRGVPSATLRIKARGLQDAGVRAEVRQRLQDAGVPLAQVELRPYSGTTREHLEQYQGCDLQLDTVPYHGTTTTCESLLMGVPVLTLEGELHAGRVGVSLLRSVGLEACVTRSFEEYVGTAIALATTRRSELEALASGLSQRMLASALCDAKSPEVGFGDAFLAGLREAWEGAGRA